MPNAKLGTIVDEKDMKVAVDHAKKGRITYRQDKAAILHATVGKVDFEDEHLVENIAFLLRHLLQVRPKGVKGSGAKGYFKSLSLSSTMGKGVDVDLESAVALALNKQQQRRAVTS